MVNVLTAVLTCLVITGAMYMDSYPFTIQRSGVVIQTELPARSVTESCFKSSVLISWWDFLGVAALVTAWTKLATATSWFMNRPTEEKTMRKKIAPTSHPLCISALAKKVDKSTEELVSYLRDLGYQGPARRTSVLEPIYASTVLNSLGSVA